MDPSISTRYHGWWMAY